jgi:hypothetical protein
MADSRRRPGLAPSVWRPRSGVLVSGVLGPAPSFRRPRLPASSVRRSRSGVLGLASSVWRPRFRVLARRPRIHRRQSATRTGGLRPWRFDISVRWDACSPAPGGCRVADSRRARRTPPGPSQSCRRAGGIRLRRDGGELPARAEVPVDEWARPRRHDDEPMVPGLHARAGRPGTGPLSRFVCTMVRVPAYSHVRTVFDPQTRLVP